MVFTAQSASKVYDGTALSLPDGVAVSGLPEGFRAEAAAEGSQLNAGSSPNRVTSFTIRNPYGEEVTDHFTSISTVDGRLTVIPAPLTVVTGSAEKNYDGTPLTNPEAYLAHGEDSASPDRAACAACAAADGEDACLWGLWGMMPVYSAHPLTGEIRETTLRAGQKLTVMLSGEKGGLRLVFRTENVKEDELPQAVLGFFAQHEALLARACEEAGWSMDTMRSLLDGLDSAQTEEGRLIPYCACIELTLNGTNADGLRKVREQEARIITPAPAAGIRVTATGSQRTVGESENGYEIDWGGESPENYILLEQLGTLRINPCQHVWDRGQMTREPTCVSSGEILYRCELCGWTRTERTEPDQNRHPGSTRTTGARQATCVSEGYTGDIVCASCGAWLGQGTTLPPDPQNHTGGVGSADAQAAGCARPGYSGNTVCVSCGAILSRGQYLPIDRDHHTGGTVTIGERAATCTTAGYTGDVVCLGCRAVLETGQTTQPDPGNHAGGTETRPGVPATCSAPGTPAQTVCLGCGAVISSGDSLPVDPDAHQWILTGETQATCVSEGRRTYVCAYNSAHTKEEILPIDPDRHTALTTETERAATCTETGYTGSRFCADCGAVLTPGTVIPALGHEWAVTLQGTTVRCTRCGAYKTP